MAKRAKLGYGGKNARRTQAARRAMTTMGRNVTATGWSAPTQTSRGKPGGTSDSETQSTYGG